MVQVLVQVLVQLVVQVLLDQMDWATQMGLSLGVFVQGQLPLPF